MPSNAKIQFFFDTTFPPGLVGPLVTCKKGSLQQNGIPKGYDAERFVLMGVMDENKSWYLDESMRKYCYASRCNSIDKGNIHHCYTTNILFADLCMMSY